ncbi:MAG: hypothetical protein JOZ78_05825 [Chroococcidiopsidaceae cyanobacterium CP_BM_ER_R8_30]|nr:hypothetical protein [Chroococcidiopsidaceae cyanobacterium CP_BM_ER_R8_30]
MKCPVCRATYRSSGVRVQGLGARENANSNTRNLIPQTLNCHRCGVDLSPLIYIHDQAIWYHRQAIQALQVGDYLAATNWNHQALALDINNANFQALAGQLWALQGELRQAIVAWEKAQQLNPLHPTANAYLQALEEIAAQTPSGRLPT